jgi:hypothetical protein
MTALIQLKKRRIISSREKPTMMPRSDCTPIIARKIAGIVQNRDFVA